MLLYLSQQAIRLSADCPSTLIKTFPLFLRQQAIPPSAGYSFTPRITCSDILVSWLSRTQQTTSLYQEQTLSHISASRLPRTQWTTHFFTQIQIPHSYFTPQSIPHSVDFAFTQINLSLLAVRRNMRKESCKQNTARRLL